MLGPSSQCLDTDLVAYMEKYQVGNASISSICCFLCWVLVESSREVIRAVRRHSFPGVKVRNCVFWDQSSNFPVVLAHRNILSHDTLPVGQGSQSPGSVRKGWGWMKDGVSADGSSERLQLQKTWTGQRERWYWLLAAADVSRPP